MRHAFALSFALAAATAHGDYYTWVCDDGIRHNGSMVPNDAVECGYQRFSDDGNLLHRELSLHEKEQAKLQNADAEAQRLEAEEQAARDQRWMLIYGSAAEAEAMRDRRITGVESKISELREQESRVELNLRKAEEDARDFERQGHDVPPTVYENIRKLEQRSIENDEQIEQRRAEIEGIVAEFQVVIDRLRELVGE
jgi:hypothetical protein